MTDFQQELRPMLRQFSNSVGRGNLIAANATLVTILESMAAVIDRSACTCNCPPRGLPEAPPPVAPSAAPRPRGRPRKER
jgi:hypothetical protein